MKSLLPSIPLLFAVVTTPAVAQQGSIELKSEAFKEVETVDRDGRKEYKLVAPGLVLPKDEILYITTFTNVGDKPATDVVITNAVPNNSVYKTGSAFGAGTDITYSIDGGKVFAAADKLFVDEDNGRRPARADEYSHIRWIYHNQLAPGASGTVTFRTIVQ